MSISFKDWVTLNQRTRPVSKELTDEFVKMCERDPDNILMRLARVSGLPEGIHPGDPRILKLFEIERPK